MRIRINETASIALSADSLNIGENVAEVTFIKSRLFTDIIEHCLKRYLFTTGENNCSCAVESQADLPMRIVRLTSVKGGSATIMND